LGKKYKRLKADFEELHLESERLREQNTTLTKQLALAPSETEVSDLRKRLKATEDDKGKLNGDFLAQTAELGGLKTRFASLQSDHDKLKEDASTSNAISSTEVGAIQDTLNATKAKITEIAAENDALRAELAKYKAENDAISAELGKYKTAQALVDNTKPAVVPVPAPAPTPVPANGTLKTPYGDVSLDGDTARGLFR